MGSLCFARAAFAWSFVAAVANDPPVDPLGLPAFQSLTSDESLPAEPQVEITSAAIEERVARIESLLYAGNWRTARTIAERSVAVAGSNSLLRTRWADALWRAGQLRRAATVYEQILATDRDCGEAWFGRVRWLLVRGLLDEALAQSLVATQVASRDVESWFARVAALSRAGQDGPAHRARQHGLSLLEEGDSETASLDTNDPFIHEDRDPYAFHQAAPLMGRPSGFTAVDSSAPPRLRRPLIVERDRPMILAKLPRKVGPPRRLSLLIDTGGSTSVALDESCHGWLDYEPSGVQLVGGISGHEPAWSGVLKTWSLDEWQFENVPVVLFPMTEGEVDPPYDGILGPSVAAGRVMSLNFKNEAFLLRPPPEDGSPYPVDMPPRGFRVPFFLFRDGKSVVEVQVDGESCLGLLDTGSRRSYRAEALGNSESSTIHVADHAVSLELRHLPEVLERRISPRLGVEVSLLLGMDFFLNFDKVVLDYHSQTLFLLPPPKKP